MGVFARAPIERYRCPASFLRLNLSDILSEHAGYFKFGPDITCYGRPSVGYVRPQVEPVLYDVLDDVIVTDFGVSLPFDPTETIDNLLLERYAIAQDSSIRTTARDAYYFVRPILSPLVRRQIQRLQLIGWRKLSFPRWPVDETVENICDKLLLLVLRAIGDDRIPFIWFWPEGFSGCVMMTHDVEGAAGWDFCTELMDIDDSFGIKASFQIVPQGHYRVSTAFLEKIRERGFEVALQDLNHDGRLFDEHKKFLRRAKLINAYSKKFGAQGFRAAVLYRNPEWFDHFEFSFDMSIPNTARLDPQRGGCCTVMPYFIGKILELPVTTTQDYMLFHLLGENSIQLWKEQLELILDKSGLASFIIHPDYVIHPRVRKMYIELLDYLHELWRSQRLWLALPSEVDRWWRVRSKLLLVRNANGWRIEGEGCERATLAYARNVDGKLVYELEAVARA